jgi:hypothetical protein
MKIKIMYPNNKGKIELTKEELEKLLNESYSEGYSDGCYKSYYSISTQSYPRITYDYNDLNISSISSATNSSDISILNNCVKADDSLTTNKIEETEICNVAGIGVMKTNEV